MMRLRSFCLLVYMGVFVTANMCSAGSWYDFFTSPFRWVKSWYTGEPIEKKLSIAELRLRLGERLILLRLGNYPANACDAFAAEVASGIFDPIINDNIVGATSNLSISILSFLLSEYYDMSRLSDRNSVLARGNLIATIRKHGGKAFSNYSPTDDTDAFYKLSSFYSVLGIMLEGSEILLQKGKRTLEEHNSLLQVRAQCKELARLFYEGDPALFEDVFVQGNPEIAAFAAQVSQDIKEDPKFREALITVLPKVFEHIDTMVGLEETEEENLEEPREGLGLVINQK